MDADLGFVCGLFVAEGRADFKKNYRKVVNIFWDNPIKNRSVTGFFDQDVVLSCDDGLLYTVDVNGELLWSFDANSALLSA